MENTKTLNALDDFAKSKLKDIPRELEEFLRFVATTGDPVYQWSLVKILFRQKLLNVITEFFESSPMVDVPLSPNLEPFNFENIKKQLLERYDTFSGVPFTIQRLAELLTTPKKQYSRLDKFMRALEKNIWVVSTREPACRDVSDQSAMVNGAPPSNVVNVSKVTSSPETILRQIDATDSDDEEEEPTGKEAEPGLLQQPTNQTEQYNFDALGETAPATESPLEALKVTESVEDEATPVATSPETDSSKDPSEPQTATEDSEANELNDSSISSKPTPPEPALDEKEDDLQIVDSTSQKSPELSGPETVEEIEKTEELSVIEVKEESCATGEITDGPIDPVLPLDEKCENSAPQSSEQKPELKRKIEEVSEDDNDIPSKKIETDAEHITLIATSVLSETTVQVPKTIIEENLESEAVVAQLLDAESVAQPVVVAPILSEAEGEMESSSIEEKIEMMVEEPDLAMDVDETSVQSPMAQEDMAEPMEASEGAS